mgnify:CR=1 FL=1
MDIGDIQSIMIDSYQVGYMEAVKAYEPAQDLIRLRDVKKVAKNDADRLETIQYPRKQGTDKAYQKRRKQKFTTLLLFFLKPKLSKPFR